jgi:hypothetical protein
VRLAEQNQSNMLTSKRKLKFLFSYFLFLT